MISYPRLAVERLIYSASNYWVALLLDLAGVVAFAIVGLWLFAGSVASAVAIVTLGSIAWGPVEYAVHRWVLHGPPSIARRAHARHHADAGTLISAPIFTSTAAALVGWGVLSVPLAAGTAALCVLGLYAGYNYYALFHHLEHRPRRRPLRWRWLAQLEAAHRIHHARHDVNYGVSTICWDRCFGSYRAPGAPSVPAAGARRTVAGEGRTRY